MGKARRGGIAADVELGKGAGQVQLCGILFLLSAVKERELFIIL